jgi:hypothetical protein
MQVHSEPSAKRLRELDAAEGREANAYALQSWDGRAPWPGSLRARQSKDAYLMFTFG